MKTNKQHSAKQGFTLVEVLIATTITTLVVASAISLFIFIQRTWHLTSVKEEAAQTASMALSRMVYGASSTHRGIRSSSSVTRSETTSGWKLNITDDKGTSSGYFEYQANAKTIVFQPPGTNQAISIADSITLANAVIVDANTLDLLVRAQINRGRFSEVRQLTTRVSWRN